MIITGKKMKVPGQNKYLCVTSIENGQKVAKYIIAQKFAVSEMIDFEFFFSFNNY